MAAGVECDAGSQVQTDDADIVIRLISRLWCCGCNCLSSRCSWRQLLQGLLGCAHTLPHLWEHCGSRFLALHLRAGFGREKVTCMALTDDYCQACAGSKPKTLQHMQELFARFVGLLVYLSCDMIYLISPRQIWLYCASH